MDPYQSNLSEQARGDFEESRTAYDRCASLLNKVVILWERRRRFLTRFLIAVAVCTLLIYLIPKHYEATATLMPPDDNSLSIMSMMMGAAGDDSSGSDAGAGAGAGAAASAIGDMLGLKSTGELYIHAVLSRTVVDRMIERFDLMHRYHEKNIADCRKDVAWYTDVNEDRKSGTIDISVTDKDPNFAQQMAQAYVEELNTRMLEINIASARQEREVTGQRVEEAQRELAVAANNLADFASKNTTLEPDEQAKAAVEISAAIEGQLIEAQTDLKSLEQLYTPNNQRVYSAKARIVELQKQLASANSAGLHGENTEGDLPSVRKLPLVGVQYLELFRNLKVREAVLKVLTQEYELARIREHHQVSTVSVMDYPVVPAKKSFPPRALMVLASAFLAFWACAAWTLFGYWWETSDEQQNRWKALLVQTGARLSRAWRQNSGRPSKPGISGRPGKKDRNREPEMAHHVGD